ncbi:hypothetical protein [Azohydromonas caseinilytica]|uniref:Porin n=1 Tax=Azohydromonas caseinilytica TaxID=2728836 RepID=A0A848F8E4_9BURK|nr:hypothetical protein [Azohydromonas caseinilytica]NML16407.1 hypothetical protein [Azohydromonas caseinilytica]
MTRTSVEIRRNSLCRPWLALALALPVTLCAQTSPQTYAPHRGAPPPPDPPPGEPTNWREGWQRSFALPVHQLFNGTAPHLLSVRLALDAPLKADGFSNLGFQSQGEVPSSPTLQLGLRYMPLEGWFVRTNLLRYLNPSEQRPWNPDFTYAFGFEDWRPYTFSFFYSNDGGNRFHPDRARGERVTRFDEGSWSLGYKFPLTPTLRDWVPLSEQHSVGCGTALRYTHRYADAELGARQVGKKSASLGCRYVYRQYWFAALDLVGYPVRRQQQPWDPDFTYSFGYADWSSGGLVVQYANYSGNRFPWRERAPGTGRLRDGSISVAITWNINL